MSMTDPVADFLTRIRNALMASHESVNIPASKEKLEIAKVFKNEGYIEHYEAIEAPDDQPGSLISIKLKYSKDRKPAILGLRRVSRPGRRVYVGVDSIPKVQGGLGTAVISTSKGLMTGHQARKDGIGGEVLAEIW